MALSVDPPVLQIAAAGGFSVHNLVNSGETRLAFKVKSTNNDHYRLKPVYGFVEPNASASIEITRLCRAKGLQYIKNPFKTGPPKEDKLVIQFVDAPAEVTDAAAHFKGSAPQGEAELPINATE